MVRDHSRQSTTTSPVNLTMPGSGTIKKSNHDNAYNTARASVSCELLERKSRFIACLSPITSREEAMAEIARLRKVYPDARHHCWAYLLGEPSRAANAGMNDDGEPAGTAGRPILNAISHSGFGDIVVVVVRYFGGIKLGAGGLVRAYGAAAREALELAQPRRVEPLARLLLDGGYADEQWLRHVLLQLDARILSVGYDAGVTMEIELAQSRIEALGSECSARSITLKEVG